MAFESCNTLTGDKSLKADIKNDYEAAIQEAALINAIEGGPVEIESGANTSQISAARF